MVNFGVAGYPLAYSKTVYKKDRFKVLDWLNEMNLNAFEMQMTYGPRSKKEFCLEFGKQAYEKQIVLSIHASYFIVLTSNDPIKLDNSFNTLLKTYDLADLLGVKKVILHPGPLYDLKSEIIIERLLNNLHVFFKMIGKTDIGLFLETAGKIGQFGSVMEIVKVANEFEACFPCIDFGHVHARTLGSLDNDHAINELFLELDSLKVFDKKRNIHFHYTPIHYGKRGEIKHKALDDLIDDDVQGSFKFSNSIDNKYHPRFECIIKNIYDRRIKCTVISETHNSQEIGAMEMSSYYYKLAKS